MNDERLRWALEQLAAEGHAKALWALGRDDHLHMKRHLDQRYAATFKLPKDRA